MTKRGLCDNIVNQEELGDIRQSLWGMLGKQRNENKDDNTTEREKMMKKEYRERMKRANEAADKFFDAVQEAGDINMLQNDKEVRELYLQALEVTEPASVEERDFHFEFCDFYLFKAIVMINMGWFDQAVGKKTLTSRELKPMYDELTYIIDGAIKMNDRNKPDYIQRRADIISSFNEELEKHGFTIKQDGCYIATAVYGSYDCPPVWTLRRYRDNVLSSHFLGRVFIHVYYFLSPTLVKWFGDQKWFVHLWRRPLDVVVCKLLNKGYEDTPYTD